MSKDFSFYIPVKSVPQPENSITLVEVAQYLRKKWYFIVLSIVFSILAAAVIFLYTEKYYTAHIVLLPTAKSYSTNSQNSFFSLANLAGINVEKKIDDMLYAKLIIFTNRFLTEFVIQYNLTDEIIAIKGWNKLEQVSIYDEKKFEPNNHLWKNDKTGHSFKPSTSEAVAFLRKNIQFDNAKDGTYSLSVKHFSPVVAEKIANYLLDFLDNTMRNQEINDLEVMIGKLIRKLEETTLFEHQQMLHTMIDNQKKTIVIKKGMPNYIFKAIDNMEVSSNFQYSLSPIYLFSAALVIGIIISVTLLTLVFTFNQRAIYRQ